MRKTFPVHSYPWHIQDWTNSKVRLTASLSARSIYRELIDFCTAEGYVPADPYFMSRVAACTPEDIAKYWPEIEHKFQQDPNDSTKLTNKKALSIRKTIQSRKLKQSKANTGKRKETEGVTKRVNLGSTLSQPRVNPPPPSPSPSPLPSLIESSSPPTPQGGLFVSSDSSSSQENGTGKSQGIPPGKSDLEKATQEMLETVAGMIHGRHRQRKCSLTIVKAKLRTIIATKPANEQLATLAFVDRGHEAWCKSDDWTREDGRYQKGLEFFLNPQKERWMDPAPVFKHVDPEDKF